MHRLLAVGLNPALQKTLTFSTFTVGEVNRAEAMHLVPGGKGYHFSRAANTVAPGSCTVAHFLGGETGRFVSAFHERLGIPQLTVDVQGATRTCTTVLNRADGRMTELIDPSDPIPAAKLEEMRSRLAELLPEIEAIALCGTFPPGVDDTFYEWVASHAGDALLLLDGYRGVDRVLATGRVNVLKINLHELAALTGTGDVASGAHQCMRQYGLSIVALTDGPGRAHLFEADRQWRITLPVLDRVANPIGAGDTVAGVMTCRLLEREDALSAFVGGLAAGTASCRHLEGAKFTHAEMADIRRNIVVEEIP